MVDRGGDAALDRRHADDRHGVCVLFIHPAAVRARAADSAAARGEKNRRAEMRKEVCMNGKTLLAEAIEMKDEIVENRRAIHRTPEVGAHLPQTVQFVEEKLRLLGYYMLLYSTDDVNEVFRTVMAWNIDGVIALSFSRNDCNKIWHLIHKPVVSIDAYGISHDDTPVTNIGLDDSTGGGLMSEYLLQCGYENILVCATNDYGVDYSRWTGAREMFEELTVGNKEKKIRLINIGETQITRESFYQQLLRQIPFPTKTAAFFLSDYFAIEAISYLGSKGIRVPADLGIAGFDDINYAHLTVPKLTTIHQNMERKAELAVTELLSAIQNPFYMGKEVLLDVMLIARDSI